MRVTSKGQVTIPKHIRDHLGIKPGSEVEFVREADKVRLVPANGATSREDRVKRFRDALQRMAGTIDTGGMDGREYVDWLRGPREDLDID
jgi:AbrB family looped-hinge helix DNA binding protein